MNRITESMVEKRILAINDDLNRPTIPWSWSEDCGKLRSNLGNLHLYRSMGVWALDEMSTLGGGVNRVLTGISARDLFNQLVSFQEGARYQKEAS